MMAHAVHAHRLHVSGYAMYCCRGRQQGTGPPIRAGTPPTQEVSGLVVTALSPPQESQASQATLSHCTLVSSREQVAA